MFSVRLILRFALALGHLDHRWTAMYAMLSAVAYIYKVIELSPEFYIGQALAGEFLNVLGTWFFFFLVETWLLERTVAVRDAQELAFEQVASNRLLAIFCDASLIFRNIMVCFDSPPPITIHSFIKENISNKAS